MRAFLFLPLLLTTSMAASAAAPSWLGAALLDGNYMPPNLLLQQRDPVTPAPRRVNVGNGTLNHAFSTMNYHRRMMNEYLCRGYMAQDILESLQLEAEATGKSRRRMGKPSSSKDNPARRSPENPHKSLLLNDQGSSSYRDWLTRSATLQDIYRRYEGMNEEDSEEEEEEDDGKQDEYEGEVTGWAVEEPSTWNEGTKLASAREPHGGFEEYDEHSVKGGSGWSGSGGGGWHGGSGLSLGLRDIFDVALTALAFLAFGMFILNLFLGILAPSSALLNRSTVYTSNLTLPFRSREEISPKPLPAEVHHERIAKRWAEASAAPLPLLPQEDEGPKAEEVAARWVLASLGMALRSPTPGHCLQASLCKSNKASRELLGPAKYWLPVWSLGLSWLGRSSMSEQVGSQIQFSSALENLRASTLGLAGARCESLFPSC